MNLLDRVSRYIQSSRHESTEMSSTSSSSIKRNKAPGSSTGVSSDQPGRHGNWEKYEYILCNEA